MNNYWDDIADEYQEVTRISCEDFHYGPMVAGDRVLQILPGDLAGLICLELGCGAAQNSIYLAGRGARCTAVDNSSRQLEHAASAAGDWDVKLELVQADMESLPVSWQSRFDLVHSSYALPFCKDQGRAISEAARCLRPGGLMLISTAHPLSTHEWAELEDGALALLVENYFEPPPDQRLSAFGQTAVCQPVTTGQLVDHLRWAGLAVLRILEPAAISRSTLGAENLSDNAPYSSDDWMSLLLKLQKVPPVLIVLAQKGDLQ